MSLIQVTGVHFSYPGHEVLRGATLQIEEGDRIGLVGPNGAGKSTLLRVLAGELVPDGGGLARGRHLRVGYLHQSQELGGEGDVWAALLSPFARVLALRAEIAAVEPALGRADKTELARYGALQDEYHHLEGYGVEARCRALASDVGLSEQDFGRPVSTLSGGERGRLELAKVLLSAPDLLLLDEPTNHLDMDAVEKLEELLCGYRGAFVLCTHDRYFLDQVCKQIADLDGGTLVRYGGGYRRYLEERQRRRAQQEELAARQQQEIERQEEFIRRNLAGQKTKQAKSRRRLLERVERVSVATDQWREAGRLGMRFLPDEARGGKEVLRAEGLTLGYPGQPPLVTGLDLAIYRGDRLGIVGPNGCGKSTLLCALLGRQRPSKGSVQRGTEVHVGYLDQKLSGLEDDRSLIEEIRSVRADLSVDAVRTYLARFRFYGDEPFRVVRGLSGGERNRVALAKLMLRPRNLLVLDEPTNHLDIPAREALEEALDEFEGTLVVVSHDRYFLDRTVHSILHLRGGRAELHSGNYSDLRAREREREQERERERGEEGMASAAAASLAAAAAAAPAPERPPAGNTEGAGEPASPSSARAAWEAERERTRELERLRRRLAAVETEIATIEGRVAELRAQLAVEHGSNWQRLNKLVEEESAGSARLAKLMASWEQLGAELEKRQGGKDPRN